MEDLSFNIIGIGLCIVAIILFATQGKSTKMVRGSLKPNKAKKSPESVVRGIKEG
jgi:hypothetical protein